MNSKHIPFSIPCVIGKELEYIKETLNSKKISGDGYFTKKSSSFLENKYGFKKVLLTTSCTDALEMASILCSIDSNSEIILPSFTFVSTALPFVLRSAKLVFCDSEKVTPNIDTSKIESLITKNTKAIVVVHYAGVACNMDEVIKIANKYNLYIIEDAAQAIDSYYNGKPLGTFGDVATFSFHETKNVTCGEGGAIVLNNNSFINRAEILREKGTNRASFFRGEVNKYGWIDIGSSFLPSDILAAYLYGQLESIELIQSKRLLLWNRYFENLSKNNSKGVFELPYIPPYATNNAHIFYLKCNNLKSRSELIAYLKAKHISATFHYLPLEDSEYYKDYYTGEKLVNSNEWSNCIIRLPLFYGLSLHEVDLICEEVLNFVNTVKC
jgi:dTDP-4-amino-4,6-dideoxygalactose transaminase